MADDTPLILWFRRDLRLDDHPMLAKAAASGRKLLPVFILDPETEVLGAAAKGRLGLSLQRFGKDLAERGLPLVLRRGEALAVLEALLKETRAGGVWWTRLYDRDARARDSKVKAALREAGTGAESFPGHVLAEPWEIQTGQGGPYRVYTPFWNALRKRGVEDPIPLPRGLRAAASAQGDSLEDWALDKAMNRGGAVLWPHQSPGEAAARDRLDRFLDGPIETYAEDRNRLDRPEACSGLSENLAWGEIGPRRVWHLGLAAREGGAAGAERFLMELAWRDFAWHLLYHYPEMDRRNWREDWDAFPWRRDNKQAEAWRQGRTGEPLVDAAMRELWVTGRMHNRARMVVASYLTKHLLTDWRVGLAHFADQLTDWDPASNAMGWQWVAGSGPDASPYFRIFNPESQAEKVDPTGAYRRRWLAEGQAKPGKEALAYFDAIPRAWGLTPDSPAPKPVIALAEGRARALEAYSGAKGKSAED